MYAGHCDYQNLSSFDGYLKQDQEMKIVAAQSRLDWGDKVITQNHPPTPPTTNSPVSDLSNTTKLTLLAFKESSRLKRLLIDGADFIANCKG